MENVTEEKLVFKWGTLKAWDIFTPKSMAAAEKYLSEEVSASAMAQRDTETQYKALIELIDAVAESGGAFYLDWAGEYVDRNGAIAYMEEYRRDKSA